MKHSVRVLDSSTLLDHTVAVALADLGDTYQNLEMISETRTQRRYDHRLQELVSATGKVDIAIECGVPRSTAYGWLARPVPEVVTLDLFDSNVADLQREIVWLRRRNARLIDLFRLIASVLRVACFSLSRHRISTELSKVQILRAIEQARQHFPLRSVLRVIGLTHSRFYNWNREASGLYDVLSCPKSSPQQLTAAEVNTIREMATSDEYRHVPAGRLARVVERLGKVFASASTWYRLIRIHRWRRPRLRVHPAKPRVGIRAVRSNEIWHIDTTIIQLLDGGRVYQHAVIDDYSRRILAWRVLKSFHPDRTAQLLLDAVTPIGSDEPTVLVDGGVENYNTAVDKVIEPGLLKRVLAQTEIRCSNSMIESWWRVLKHHWLYLNQLDSAKNVTKLVAFYVEQHNSHLPHSAFQGQTPDEMYFGTGAHFPKQLEAARLAARQF